MGTESILRVQVVGTDSLTKYKQEIDKTEKELRELRKTTNKQKVLTKEQAKAQSELTLKLKDTRNAYRDEEAAILKSNNALRKNSGFVNGITKGLTKFTLGLAGVAIGITAVVSIFKDGVQTLRDFELQQKRVQALLGDATQDEVEALKKQMLDLGRSTQFTATQVGLLQEELVKLGFTTDEILAATDAILDLSVATQGDLARAAEVTGATLRAFNIDASDTQRVVDVMAKAFTSSALNLERFGKAMSTLAPIAKLSNSSLEATTALLGVLIDRGVDASTAGTALRNVMIELADQGLSLDEALEQINSSTNKVSKANELFGKRSATVAAIIAENTDEVRALNVELLNSEGSAKKMAATIGDTLDGSIKRATSAWEGLILQLGGSGSIIKSIVDGFVNITNSLTDFLDPAENANKAFRDQRDLVSGLESDVVPLIDRYEELITKTVLNEKEQKELNILFKQLEAQLPNTVLEFDKYGNAISLNTKQSKEWIKQQQEILKIKTAEAFEESKESLQELDATYNQLKNTIETITRTGVLKGPGGQILETADALPRLNAELLATGTNIKNILLEVENTGRTVEGSAQRFSRTFSEPFKSIEENEKKSQDVATRLGLTLGVLAEKVGFVSSKQKENTKVTEDQINAIKDEISAIGNLGTESLDVAEKRKKAQEKQAKDDEKALQKILDLTADTDEKRIKLLKDRIDAVRANIDISNLEKIARELEFQQEIDKIGADAAKREDKRREDKKKKELEAFEFTVKEAKKAAKEKAKNDKIQDDIDKAVEDAKLFAKDTAFQIAEQFAAELRARKVAKIEQEADEDIEALKSNSDKEIDAIQEKIATIKADKDLSDAQKKKSIANLNAQILNIEKSTDNSIKDIEEDALKRSRKAQIAEQLIAATQASVNTYLAASKALATLPPPASFITAGATIVAGLAQVAQIVSFDKGGHTGSAGIADPNLSGRSIVGYVHDNEYVADTDTMNTPRGAAAVGTLEAIRTGKLSGFADGGFATPPPVGLAGSTVIREVQIDEARLAKLVGQAVAENIKIAVPVAGENSINEVETQIIASIEDGNF